MTWLGIRFSNAYVDEFSLQMYYGPCMGSIVQGTLWETGYYKQPTTAALLAMYPTFNFVIRIMHVCISSICLY